MIVFLPVNDEEGLENVDQELEARAAAPFLSDRSVFTIFYSRKCT